MVLPSHFMAGLVFCLTVQCGAHFSNKSGRVLVSSCMRTDTGCSSVSLKGDTAHDPGGRPLELACARACTRACVCVYSSNPCTVRWQPYSTLTPTYLLCLCMAVVRTGAVKEKEWGTKSGWNRGRALERHYSSSFILFLSLAIGRFVQGNLIWSDLTGICVPSLMRLEYFLLHWFTL